MLLYILSFPPLDLQNIETIPVLQIVRKGNRDNMGIISHILHQNIFCDPPLEPFHRDGPNEGSQYMFLLRNKKNYYPLLMWGHNICSRLQIRRSNIDNSEIIFLISQ